MISLGILGEQPVSKLDGRERNAYAVQERSERTVYEEDRSITSMKDKRYVNEETVK